MASGTPDYSPRIISSASASEQIKISVTQADSSGSFSQQVRSLIIHNAGVNDVYVEFDAAATINKFKIPAFSYLSIDVPVTTPHFICATGETATVYIIGVY